MKIVRLIVITAVMLLILSCVKPPKFIEEHIDYQEANRHEKPEKVEKRFKTLLNRNPQNADAMYLYGRLLKDADAEKWFEKALKADPRNRYAMGGIALNWLRKGKPEIALEWGLKSVKGDTTFWRGYLNNVEILDSLHQYQDALAQMRKLLRYLPITNPNLKSILAYREEVRVKYRIFKDAEIERIERERKIFKRKSAIMHELYSPIGYWEGESDNNGHLEFNFTDYGRYSLKIGDGSMRVNGTWRRDSRNTFTFSHGNGKIVGNKFFIHYGTEDIILKRAGKKKSKIIVK
ncbi:MAG: hypothetical protein K8S56_09470 [Candidatus Cloacimonetes bacterium]|nr:hypothetical protein [Candidatus Cloacimonadota bacterium]